MKINQLIDDIKQRDLVLPEFQREYVWRKEQVKQLMVSLVRNYPVGGLLFWKTDNPPELKNLDDLPDKLGTIELILDGQQRLTSLYLLLTGEIPPYYRNKDITTDPRDLFFNVDDGDFQYYQATRMKGNNLWLRVTDCFSKVKINVFEIAKQTTENDSVAFELAEKYNSHLNSLRQIEQIDLPVQTVPIHATIEEAIDIFDRVNSQGTKLTDAELALTHITAKWPHARRVFKSKIDILSRHNFYFDLTFMTRALTGVVTKRALFEHIHKSDHKSLLDGWQQLSKILDYLISILPNQARIHSTEDVNTQNAFVPLVVYLSLHNGRFPNEMMMRRAIHWLYAALMWSRYTAQTDQRLEHDVSLVVRHENPWPVLVEQIEDQRGRIEVKASDFEGRGAQHPLFRMSYIISKVNGAVDWFNGAPLGTTKGKAYRLHSHHIFPSSYLYKNGYESHNHIHRKIVNDIANRAFLTADTNRELSNKPPIEYFPHVEENYKGALSKQFIPMNPEFWIVENYEAFLELRRKMIADEINSYMNSLLIDQVDSNEEIELSIVKLISLGEGATIEFKSSYAWDVREDKENKGLKRAVIKSIAAFLNSEGGTLLIGVEDDGAIFGLEKDFNLMGKKLTDLQKQDKFELKLMQDISNQIGPEFSRFIRVRFENIEDRYVCAVDVSKSAEPAFAYLTDFYVRVGTMTKSLRIDEATRYIRMNWE